MSAIWCRRLKLAAVGTAYRRRSNSRSRNWRSRKSSSWGTASAAALQRPCREGFDGAGPGEGGFIRALGRFAGTKRAIVSFAEHGHGHEASVALEYEAVKVSLANLRSFPYIRQREAEGKTTLRGAHFAIADGLLRILDEASGVFLPVK